KLPEHMVPSAFVALEALPLTPSGKLDRRALPEAAVPPPSAMVPPRTPDEELLAGIWAQVLGLERVGIHDDFFALGGHSLLATQAASRIRDAFGVELPLRRFFDSPTVAGLAGAVRAAQGHTPPPPLEPMAGDGDPPLSFAQERLWFLDRLTPDNPFYNSPVALRLAGALDIAALDQSWREIQRRHAILRTTFRTAAGRPVQVIHPDAEQGIAVVAAQDQAEVRRLAMTEARRTFDLERGPLCRAVLARLSAAEHVLLISLHHIVTDGWSMGVFVRELSALYAAFSAGQPSPLPELPIQYADFARWQRDWLRGEALASELSYWRRQLAGAPQALELPGDRPRPAVHTFRGDVAAFALSPELTHQLKQLSRQAGATLFMTTLAAFALLLSRHSGQEDLLIGAPIANRNRREVEPLIGFFVNTLVLRVDVSGNPPFRRLLERVRQITLDAYAHQDLPFEQLVEALQPARDMTRNPLVQVALAFQNAALPSLTLGTVQAEPLDLDSGAVRFDLEFHLWEDNDRLTGHLLYYKDLFETATVHRLLGRFQTLLAAVAADPDRPIGHWPLLDAGERQRLLDWNRTAADFPQCGLHRLFEEQAKRTPQAMAVAFGEQSLSYAQLNRRANHLAHYLRRLGVGPEVVVGICLERSPELLVGLLAVLKAGGAYLPLDPAYPPARLAYMLDDAGVAVLLTRSGLISAAAKTVCLNADQEAIAACPDADPPGGADPDQLAYVIYTSGSTGRPKGAMNAHRGVVNRLRWMQAEYGIGAD
ncbi:MAG: condensation domain-containing protein, partial [Pseudomonadota bacterium]|nr:condensation domain-containing protein [Pseudomonadota bacterium]